MLKESEMLMLVDRSAQLQSLPMQETEILRSSRELYYNLMNDNVDIVGLDRKYDVLIAVSIKN